MKSTWLLWIIGLLGGAATASERTPPASPRADSSAARLTTSANRPPSLSASAPADPFAPFRVDDHQSIPPQPDMRSNGMQISGTSSGPVNTEERDRDFFTDPRFDHEPNCGRLFYHQFFLRNPHDPLIPERRVWFICWSPLDDGNRAQRLHERSGFLISEVTTDGISIQVHHSADVGSETRVDTLRWVGDSLGHGRFEVQGTAAPGIGISEPTAFELERDRGYQLLSDRKPAEATAAFIRALVPKPEEPAVLFALGAAWEELVGMDAEAGAKAIDAYGRALAADPRRSPAHQRRADLYESQGQPALAIAELTRFIALEPEAWEAHLDRARIHAKGANLGKAIEDAREAARKAPTEAAPLEALARYEYRSGQLQQAIATGHRLLTLDDSRSSVRVTMACAQAQLAHAAEALKTYTAARANGVSNPDRQWGIRELEKWLRSASKGAAGIPGVRRLLEQVRGTDHLEAAEEGAD